MGITLKGRKPRRARTEFTVGMRKKCAGTGTRRDPFLSEPLPILLCISRIGSIFLRLRY